MPLFFVLSGFVIHYNYSRVFLTMRPGWAIVEFIGARIARIYPLFICFLMIGMASSGVWEWVYHHKFNLFIVLAHSLTLTQSWVYIVIFGDRLVLDNSYGLSWSLSTEFFFYLSYIALVPYLARVQRVPTLMFVAIGMSAFVLLALGYGISHVAQLTIFSAEHLNDHFGGYNDSIVQWFFYYAPYVRVFEFVLGCLAAQLYIILSNKPVSIREARFSRYMLGASLAYLVIYGLAYVSTPFYRNTPGDGATFATYLDLFKVNYGCAVPIAVLIFCVSRYRSSAVAAILSTPIMIVLGDLSYSIYTVHSFVLRLFQRPPEDFHYGLEIEAIFRIGIGVALTLILSTATYRLIEVPARAWIRKGVAQGLARTFGARERNVLLAGQAFCSGRAFTVAMSFVLMMCALLAYQFLIVPHFTPYTN
jgi:peptidoglycan/LPS O-acetylase OafA/YrhL